MKKKNQLTTYQSEQEALSILFQQLDIYGLSITVRRLLSIALENTDNQKKVKAMLHSADVVMDVIENSVAYFRK